MVKRNLLECLDGVLGCQFECGFRFLLQLLLLTFIQLVAELEEITLFN